LIELLVVIAIISLLASVLLPALSKAKEQTRQVICSVNLRNLSFGSIIYGNTFNDYMVPRYLGSMSTEMRPTLHNVWWPEGLYLYGMLPINKATYNFADTKGIFWCPSSTKDVVRDEVPPAVFVSIWTGGSSYAAYAHNDNLMGYGAAGGTSPSYRCIRYSEIVGSPSSRFCFADNNYMAAVEGGYNDSISGVPYWPFLRHQGKINLSFADGHAERGFKLPVPIFDHGTPPNYPW